MASNSDYSKDRLNITEIIPEVYRSDVSNTLMDASFNRFLTKDDTVHVAGYIGPVNPKALVNRQLPEPTPHRQAFQLAPVMYSTVGTEEYTLTFKGFQQQLNLIGVDTVNTDEWATTASFNWVPPVNPDMLVDYADYFWKPDAGQTPAQYFTIESRCNKATSKLHAYQNILTRRGSTMDVTSISFEQNAFIISSKQDDLFVEGFVFYTKGTTDVNLSDKIWTTVSSKYDGITDSTTIVVERSIALITVVSDITIPVTPPTALYDGQWWYKYSSNPATPLKQLYTWTGSVWFPTPSTPATFVSLVEQEAIYQSEVNCACSSDTGGWDVKQWDDGQQGTVVWNTDLLANISFNTELEWIAHNTATSPNDLWYDLLTDELKQRTPDNLLWITVRTQFSLILADTAGMSHWDESVGCIAQESNQWVAQNKWTHKSELSTFVGATRAQVPILEYSSQTEMNSWTEVSYAWKYRTERVNAFSSVSFQPTRLELEPIKSYVATNVGGVWYIYLFGAKSSANRDVDYTSTFVPDFKFRIVDKYGMSQLFTVETSIHRETGVTDPVDASIGHFVTIVQVKETDFNAPLTAGLQYETNPPDPDAPRFTRIEPVRTSRGDSWKGYHIHWLMDVTQTTQKAVGPQQLNPYVKAANIAAVTSISVTDGSLSITDTYQEFIPSVANVTVVSIDYRFHFQPSHPGYYAIVGENQLRVYINGVRQYGTYKELPYTAQAYPDFTVVDGIALDPQSAKNYISFDFVYGIQFAKSLTVNDVVRIELSPVAFDDMGLYSIPVRTVENDTLFETQVLAGNQPAYKSLVKFYNNEQTKSKINQYPLFNIYDIITGEVINTSPIFAYVEDPAQPVNSATQRRIVVDSTGKEFMFEQFLVDADNGLMYAYRNVTGTESSYWYSPLTQMLKQWDGKTWGNRMIANTDIGMVAYIPAISPTEPTALLTVEKSVWFDSLRLVMYQRDSINGFWNVVPDVTISDADPTLHTIWQKNNQTYYVPQYVDKTDVVVTKGSTLGDWEVLSQWRNNPEHENHKTVLYSQLVTHMSSIVAQQTRIPGLTNRGIFTLSQHEYNLGMGGTIKEHNDAFDTLISAINVPEMTPVSVIEFAQEQYASNLVLMRDVFNSVIVDGLIEYSGHSVAEITTFITDMCILKFANNDFIARIYGDTTAYSSVLNKGMQNWIVTLPMFGLAAKHAPHLVMNQSAASMVHHDGHRSVISYTLAEQDRLNHILVKTLNASIPGSAVISATAPTSAILPIYWYEIGAGKNILHKLKSSVPVEWETVNYVEMLGALYLTIEQRLYDMSPTFPTPVFDFSTLTSTSTQQAVYNARMKQRFRDFTAAKQIKTPLVNTQYSATDPYTWSYAQSIVISPPTTSITPTSSACWQAVYQMWYGTPYPNLEPWLLQGYDDKPSWWDSEYLDTTSTRRWIYNHATKIGMWENIRTGAIPAGYAYPNGTISTGVPANDAGNLPTYTYFSVNIGDVAITGGYQPDDLLPPYYDNTVLAPTNPTIRSIFNVFSTQIIAPNADFTFGEVGPIEWEWSTSMEHVYDQSIVAFLMQPSKFLHQTFGLKYVEVAGLQVDVTSQKVYTHREALFHGDVYSNNKTYTASGINQWYVNFNRFNGYDTNVQFRGMWAGWVPKQAYQTAGIIDTSTLQLFNKNFDVTDRDYSVVLSNSGVINELWSDAFEVSVLNIPPAINQYNNQSKWKFSIDTLSLTSRTLNCYGTKNWPFKIDKATDLCTAFRFDIVDVLAAVNTFVIAGNQTQFMVEGVAITVSNTTNNDGVYTITKATFDSVSNTTSIGMLENVTNSIVNGYMDITSYSHNWQTGDTVVMTATSALPYPIDGKTPYYVIKIDQRTIKLASSTSNANADISIDITSDAAGLVQIGQIKSSFYAFNGGGQSQELWFHYELNKNDVRVVEPPTIMMGMQPLIDFIDGYKTHQDDMGVVYGSANFIEYDSETGRPVNWQLETERFIDWAYSLRRSRLQLNDRYEFVVSSTVNDTLKFTSSIPAWATGTSVSFSTTGSLPSPLFANTPYYFISTPDSQVFNLSLSPNPADTSMFIDITTNGSGLLHTSIYAKQQLYPAFEINPARNNIWILTPQGMLADVLTGPYADTRVTQTIHDQYGRSLTADKIVVYREDKMSRIGVKAEIPNDVQLYPAGLYDPNNFIHMGGGHFFVEGYEHIIVFNDYTVGGDLVYDPFLGLYIQRFDLDYYEKSANTLRPTLGGYFLTDSHKFQRNFEGSLQDMRSFYDAMELTEGTPAAQHARHTLGYTPNDGSMSYLDLLNVNTKSQFLFYRGMIQTKGSVNSIKAYINSKKFVDAKIDEFWMWKVADFGDSRPKLYPQIRLYAEDAVKTDIRLKFAIPSDTDTAAISDAKKGFETVSFNDGTRWIDFPQQRDAIESPLFLDAEISSMIKLYVSPAQPLSGGDTVDYWYDGANFNKLVDGAWIVATDASITIHQSSDLSTYIHFDSINDGVRVIRRRLTSPGNLNMYQTELMNEVNLVDGYTRINSEIVKFPSEQYAITSTSVMGGNIFYVSGNRTARFVPLDKIVITGTESNNGTYIVATRPAEYDLSTDLTSIFVQETVATDTSVAGTLTHYSFADVIILSTVNASANKINPARLVDLKSHVKIEDVPLWHPAVGIHSSSASHSIDLFHSGDPAQYTISTAPTTGSIPWMAPEAGTTWVDTSLIGYLPYYDDIIHPDVVDRLNDWGKHPAWSSIKVYQWVETLIDPSNWDITVTTQQNDITIPQSQKVTGTPRKTAFKRVRITNAASVISSTIIANPNTVYENGQTVYFVQSGATVLPVEVKTGTAYTVANYDIVANTFTLVELPSITDGIALIVPTFSDNWTRQPLVKNRLFAALIGDFVTSSIIREPVLTVTAPTLLDGDVVDVYVNGNLTASNVTIVNQAVSMVDTGYKMVEMDIIDIIRPASVLTTAQTTFNPDLLDDGVTLEQWTETVEYSSTVRTYGGINYTYYYYWVEGVTTKRNPADNTAISAYEASLQLDVIPTPYLIVQDPQDDLWARGFDVPPYDGTGFDEMVYTSYNDKQQYLPSIFYRKAILNKVTGYVTENDRYAVEFTRDLTLRDSLQADRNQMNLKNQHEKWLMFRRHQIGAIPQQLWIRMTEALMGTLYNDQTIHVPSFEREQYDLINGTETKYGLDKDQIFVNPVYARATILDYLQNPSNDFKPVDINHFFEVYPAQLSSFWADPQQVKNMLDFVYTTFDSVHVNSIWFEVLNDALVTKSKYKDLMKTSWLALHGIRILNVGNQFDD